MKAFLTILLLVGFGHHYGNLPKVFQAPYDKALAEFEKRGHEVWKEVQRTQDRLVKAEEKNNFQIQNLFNEYMNYRGKLVWVCEKENSFKGFFSMIGKLQAFERKEIDPQVSALVASQIKGYASAFNELFFHIEKLTGAKVQDIDFNLEEARNLLKVIAKDDDYDDDGRGHHKYERHRHYVGYGKGDKHTYWGDDEAKWVRIPKAFTVADRVYKSLNLTFPLIEKQLSFLSHNVEDSVREEMRHLAEVETLVPAFQAAGFTPDEKSRLSKQACERGESAPVDLRPIANDKKAAGVLLAFIEKRIEAGWKLAGGQLNAPTVSAQDAVACLGVWAKSQFSSGSGGAKEEPGKDVPKTPQATAEMSKPMAAFEAYQPAPPSLPKGGAPAEPKEEMSPTVAAKSSEECLAQAFLFSGFAQAAPKEEADPSKGKEGAKPAEQAKTAAEAALAEKGYVEAK